MVVDHADGLHVGVHDGGADEVEAALLEVFAEGVGDGGAGGDLFQRGAAVLEGFAVDEGPLVVAEAAELVLEFSGTRARF